MAPPQRARLPRGADHRLAGRKQRQPPVLADIKVIDAGQRLVERLLGGHLRFHAAAEGGGFTTIIELPLELRRRWAIMANLK